MLLFTLNLQEQGAEPDPEPVPVPSRHGFEMVGTMRKTVYQRVLERRESKRVRPRAVVARAKAKVIEVKAANAVLADAGEPDLRKLMNEWLKQKPPIPRKADRYEVFLGQVARRLRQMDEDEAILLLL